MRFLILVGLLCVLVTASGCLATAPYWVRRSVVHDDVVYVKSNNTLYRRYEPRGLRLPGNEALLEVEEMGISSSNEDIIVFGSLAEAEASGLDYKLGPLLSETKNLEALEAAGTGCTAAETQGN